MTLTLVFQAMTAFYLFRNYSKDKGCYTSAEG